MRVGMKHWQNKCYLEAVIGELASHVVVRHRANYCMVVHGVSTYVEGIVESPWNVEAIGMVCLRDSSETYKQ